MFPLFDIGDGGQCMGSIEQGLQPFVFGQTHSFEDSLISLSLFNSIPSIPSIPANSYSILNLDG